MNKKTLTSLFAESLYQIPDYQRGYAWEEKQWKDFIQDIDALVDEEVRGHYTGTVVVYAGRDATFQPYGIKHLRVVDVVDGQQRLTTLIGRRSGAPRRSSAVFTTLAISS